MRNPVESLAYIKCYSFSNPTLLKALAVQSDATVRESAIVREDLKPYWESEKGHIFQGDQPVFQRLY